MAKGNFYPNLDLFDLGKTSMKKKFVYLFSDNGSNGPAKSIINIIENYAKSVILENDYTDRDYNIAYSKYYSLSFREFERKCQRFHFFSAKIKPSDIVNFKKKNHKLSFDKENYEKLKKEYLGFSILRPSAPKSIGPTYIKPVQLDFKSSFVTCNIKQNSNISGLHFNVDSCPFIQQDGRVSACSTASLWIATRIVCGRFNARLFSTTEITEAASIYTIVGGSPFLSPGLTIDQFHTALYQMGYDSVSYETENTSLYYLKKVIYKYIESKIPVIIFLKTKKNEHHALTVIGYNLTKSTISNPKPLPNTNYYSSSDWVSEFIVHDDQGGPYKRVELFSENSKCNAKIIEKKEKFYKEPLCGQLYNILIPLPKMYIFTKDTDVEAKAIRILKLSKKYYEEAVKKNFPENIVMRIFIVKSNDFKNRLIGRENISPQLIILHRGKVMPKYLWVIELSTKKIRNNKEDKIIGEILIDPTSSALEPDFVSIHLPNYYTYMNPEEKTPIEEALNPQKDRWVKINVDEPYGQMKQYENEIL